MLPIRADTPRCDAAVRPYVFRWGSQTVKLVPPPGVEAPHCRLVFLPPYSPDFNFIEMAISNLKAWLRGVEARDFDSLVSAIGDGLNRITQTDARAYFRHCSYNVSTRQLIRNPL